MESLSLARSLRGVAVQCEGARRPPPRRWADKLAELPLPVRVAKKPAAPRPRLGPGALKRDRPVLGPGRNALLARAQTMQRVASPLARSLPAGQGDRGEKDDLCGALAEGGPVGATAPAAADDGGAAAESDGSTASAGARLSKNALKRLRRDEKWDAEAEKRREKRRAKRQRDKEIKRQRLAAGEEVPRRPRPSRGPNGPEKTSQHVCIDLDFDEYHQVKDIKKLMKQVQTSYAANRRADKALRMHLTSMQGLCRQRFDSTNGDRWDVEVSDRPYHEVFSRAETVYLSSESENVLDKLDDSKVYVIGGLVDHNRFKGLTHRMALERGVAHARLPIQEHFKLESRTVLTVNHVFEILLHYVNLNNWADAIRSVIPERKGLQERDSAASAGPPDEDAAAASPGDGQSAPEDSSSGGGGSSSGAAAASS